MLRKIRLTLSRYPIIYKIIMWVYANTFYLFKTSYIPDIAKYLLNTRNSDFKNLKSKGFKRIRIFKSRTWRFGHGKDGAYRRYYIARYNSKKVFIKIAKNDLTIINEISFAEIFENYNYDFINTVECIDKEFGDSTMMYATQFIESLSPFAVPGEEKEFQSLCTQFHNILLDLEKQGIVHADIHRKNLMVSAEGNLILLDFGISVKKGVDNGVDYSARPGTFYKTKKDGKTELRIYDDAYSFVRMIDMLDVTRDWLSSNEYQQIKNRIGINEHIVRIS